MDTRQALAPVTLLGLYPSLKTLDQAEIEGKRSITQEMAPM